MEAYQIIPDVYRVPGGYGKEGEAYGGVIIKDSPPILIGASGGKKFVKNLAQFFGSISHEGKFRVYLTAVTWQEVYTLGYLVDEFPESTIYVHNSLVEKLGRPRKYFMKGRFSSISEHDASRSAKDLPKKLENLVGVDSNSSYQSEKTKILVIPFNGPHEGHNFIYSRDHKLFFPGLALGSSATNKSQYYIDKTGSLEKYENGFSFIKNTTANIIAPAYDEPYFTNTNPVDTIPVSTAIERNKEAAYELVTLQPKSLEEIARKFKQLYGFSYRTEPYDEIGMEFTLMEINLGILVDEGKIAKKDNMYLRI